MAERRTEPAGVERPEQLRLFVACELPDEVRRALGGIQEDLRRLGAGRLRWVRPEGIHVTLKFLGEVEAARVEAITAALAAAVEPFELRLSFLQEGLGGFGGGRLRVVWVGLEGDITQLAALAARVEAALKPLGFPADASGRPFAAHLTLARVPDQMPPAARREVAELIGRYRSAPLPSMMLKEISLMRSILGPAGSVYQRLAAFPAAG